MKRFDRLRSRVIFLFVTIVGFCPTEGYTMDINKPNESLCAIKEEDLLLPSDSLDVIKPLGAWGWGANYTAKVRGNLAYVGNGRTLTILNVTYPDNPIIVGELVTDFVIFDLAVSGNYVYTVGPLRIIDISDPAHPILLSSLKLDKYPLTVVTVSGSYAYVGNFYGLIYIVDVSNPSNPAVKGWMLTSGERPSTIVIKDNYLFTTTSEGLTIDVFDISDPNNPVLVAQEMFGGPGIGFSINGNYLYLVTSRIPRLRIYDITDPRNPLFLDSTSFSSFPTAVVSKGNSLYITFIDGLASFDIANRTKPVMLSTLQVPYYYPQSPGIGPVQIDLNTNEAYIASCAGLWIVDIRSPYQLKTLDYFHTSWSVFKLLTDSSSHAFFLTLFAGLKILDISDPYSPRLIGDYSISGQLMRDIVISANKVYLLLDNELQIIDVSTPQNPTLISRLTLPDTLNDNNGYGAFGYLTLSNSNLYVSRNSNKLYSVDVSNPNDPKIISEVNTEGVAIGETVSGKYLYLAIADRGVRVFYISDHGTVKDFQFFNIADLRGMTVKDNTFLALDRCGFTVYEITDRFNLVAKGCVSKPIGLTTADIETYNNFAYVAYNTAFLIVDISNKKVPKIVYSDTDISRLKSCVTIEGNIIILGLGENGVQLLTNDFVSSLPLNKGKPCDFTLYQNYPNPFNPTTTICYTIPKQSFVELKVFDMLGREVSTLVNKYQNTGEYKVQLNGSSLPSGIYVYSIHAGNYKASKKLLLLK